jgi:hypothetical protein
MARLSFRLGLLLAAFGSSLIFLPTGTSAPARESPQLQLLAHLPLKRPNANLRVHKKVVYVGSDGSTGVQLIDLADPLRPALSLRPRRYPRRPEGVKTYVQKIGPK